jgi:hypothetical protein
MAGLAHPTKFTGASGKTSSFHFKLTGRGAGGHRRAKDRPYTQGEALRAIRYILREAAREIEQGGVVSNVSTDPDIVAALFSAIEELELTAGRENANVYMSLVVSLPHELDAAARELLLANICTPLAELELPYVGVLHAPDPNGDQRNTHAHVMFSWRPFEHRGDGEYGFGTQTYGELNSASFITAFRSHAADAMNEAMAAAGQARRFTPLSRAARGEAPLAKADGKLTAGQKHVGRRQEDIALAQLEAKLVNERSAALTDVIAVTERILSRPPFDWDAQLATLRATNDFLVSRDGYPDATRIMPAIEASSEPPPGPISHEKQVRAEQTDTGVSAANATGRSRDAGIPVGTIPASELTGSRSSEMPPSIMPVPIKQPVPDDAGERSPAARAAETPLIPFLVAPDPTKVKPLSSVPPGSAHEQSAPLAATARSLDDSTIPPKQTRITSSPEHSAAAVDAGPANTHRPSPATSRTAKQPSAKTETSREAARARAASPSVAAASSTPQIPPSQPARQRSAKTEASREEARRRAASLNAAAAPPQLPIPPNQSTWQPVSPPTTTQVDAGWERVPQSSTDTSQQAMEEGKETKPNEPAKASPQWTNLADSDATKQRNKKPRRSAPTATSAPVANASHSPLDGPSTSDVEAPTDSDGRSAVSDNLGTLLRNIRGGRES